MSYRRLSILAAAVAMLAASGVPSQTWAAGRSEAVAYGEADPCLAEVKATIAELGFKPGDVAEPKPFATLTGGAGVGPVVSGVEAWVRPKSCKGYVVLKFDAFCRYQEAYPRGNCTLPGKAN